MLASLGVTSGGTDGTSGGQAERLGLAGIAAATLVIAAVKALSVIDEHEGFGAPIAPWKPFLWEYSSALFWIALLPAVRAAARRLYPGRIGWPAAVAAQLALTLPVSAVHIAWIAGLRASAYRLVGETYGYEWTWGHLLYEYRKDVLSWVGLVVLVTLLQRWAAPAAPANVPDRPLPARLEVRDGPRTTWLAPADILWTQAAGNYVELHTAAGPLLHRTSLAALERELAPHGFARIHRSRLVRREAVRAVETNASGDFEVVLADGRRVGGSRRHRRGLDE